MGATRSARQAVILAAGNGDRFHTHPRRSKLLACVGGIPLLIRTLRCAAEAGITDAHIVLGYDAERVETAAREGAPCELTLHFHHNSRWHEENGLSLLAAKRYIPDSPFAVLMGDHIFDPAVLGRLWTTPLGRDEALLAVDYGPASPAVAVEATRVRLDGDVITAIGKELDPYDALDTGLFLCQASVFDAVEQSCVAGDTTFSGGISRLARRGLMRAVDLGQAPWCDIDTVDDLKIAQRLVAAQ